VATELCPNEGKQYLQKNVISGTTVRAFMLHGVTIAAGGITALTTLATLQATREETGTGYSRQAVALGVADANGIIVIPQVIFDPLGNTGWSTAESAWGIATSPTAGVALYYWDFSATHNLSAGTNSIRIPTLDFFYINPGE
jgi:hypothetical protein